MGSLETIVASMYQKDSKIVERMRIEGNVVIANQTNKNEFSIMEDSNRQIKMISTETRGVGLNRNIGLLAADAEILLFSDEDVCYYAGYRKQVLEAFAELPQADVILFGIKLIKNNEVEKIICDSTKRAYIWHILKYGTCSIAVRKSSILKKKIFFSQLFGGGCLYSSGEDSLFLLDCLRKGLKVYTYEYILGQSTQDESTCFWGFNKKYFYDKGSWLSCAFPYSKHIIKWYFIFRYLRMCDFTLGNIRDLMNDGIKGFEYLKEYTEN